MDSETQNNGSSGDTNNREHLEENQENDRNKIIAELTRANSVLKANISTLYRTARAEIARKNDRISELQSNLDDLLFKRMNKAGHGRNFADNNHQFFQGASTSQMTTSSDDSENLSQT